MPTAAFGTAGSRSPHCARVRSPLHSGHRSLSCCQLTRHVNQRAREFEAVLFGQRVQPLGLGPNPGRDGFEQRVRGAGAGSAVSLCPAALTTKAPRRGSSGLSVNVRAANCTRFSIWLPGRNSLHNDSRVGGGQSYAEPGSQLVADGGDCGSTSCIVNRSGSEYSATRSATLSGKPANGSPTKPKNASSWRRPETSTSSLRAISVGASRRLRNATQAMASKTVATRSAAATPVKARRSSCSAIPARQLPGRHLRTGSNVSEVHGLSFAKRRTRKCLLHDSGGAAL